MSNLQEKLLDMYQKKKKNNQTYDPQQGEKLININIPPKKWILLHKQTLNQL